MDETVTRSLIGIEIGATKLQLVAGDSQGTLAERVVRKVDLAKGALGIRQQIERELLSLVRRCDPDCIGVGFGGPVDSRRGVIHTSHQVRGWDGFPLKAWIQRLTGCPAVVENDSNTAALAEARIGAGEGLNPVFYCNMGSGVGGGLIVDGHIYRGSPPGEAEFGHLLLDRSGAVVESRCSGWALNERVRTLAGRLSPSESVLGELVSQSPGHEARYLPTALDAQDHFAEALLREFAADVALGLSHVVHLLSPEVIVIGGGVAQIGEPLRQAVETSLRPLVMLAPAPRPAVRIAAHLQDSVPIGSLLLAGDHGMT